MRDIITIIVTPVTTVPGTFIATLDGVELCQSAEPLLAAARELRLSRCAARCAARDASCGCRL